MHIKKLVVVPIISSVLITGCIKDDKDKEQQQPETPKKEEVQIKQFEEEINSAKKYIMESDYKKAESILKLVLSEYEENEEINTLNSQVQGLIEIEDKIKESNYEEARAQCMLLLLEEKIDKSVEYEVKRLQNELDKLDTNKLNVDKKDRNIKIDKNKDINSQKAMNIVIEYIKKNYPGSNPKSCIVDMYSLDGQSYYYIYAYAVKNSGGNTKEEAIGYYDVNMKNGKIIEYLICKPNYVVNISEDKAIELAKKYMIKYTDYKAESFKVLNMSSDCGDTFYCIEAYGRDSDDNLINVGYFEVHVETGIVRGDVYPPEIKHEEPTVPQQPIENEEKQDETVEETQETDEVNSESENIENNINLELVQ